MGLSVVAPAGAIAAGALLQRTLVSIWPGVQSHTILDVSLDTYFAAVALGCLTFAASLWIRRSAPARATIIPCLIVPTVWLLLSEFAFGAPPASLSVLWAVYTAIAVAPLLGVALAYALPSNNRRRGP